MNLENKIEVQRRRMEQEKNKLDMLVKKARAEQRKADNHRKIVVGANFETFLTEPRRYSEEQTRRIMRVAFSTWEVKNCVEQIERELAQSAVNEPDTAVGKETGERGFSQCRSVATGKCTTRICGQGCLMELRGNE